MSRLMRDVSPGTYVVNPDTPLSAEYRRFPCAGWETARVSAVSNGVTQVDGMDWRDVVAELLSFKSTEGDFVKRRMNRFLKDCQKHGKGPIDDIAIGDRKVKDLSSVYAAKRSGK